MLFEPLVTKVLLLTFSGVLNSPNIFLMAHNSTTLVFQMRKLSRRLSNWFTFTVLLCQGAGWKLRRTWIGPSLEPGPPLSAANYLLPWFLIASLLCLKSVVLSPHPKGQASWRIRAELLRISFPIEFSIHSSVSHYKSTNNSKPWYWLGSTFTYHLPKALSSGRWANRVKQGPRFVKWPDIPPLFSRTPCFLPPRELPGSFIPLRLALLLLLPGIPLTLPGEHIQTLLGSFLSFFF